MVAAARQIADDVGGEVWRLASRIHVTQMHSSWNTRELRGATSDCALASLVMLLRHGGWGC